MVFFSSIVTLVLLPPGIRSNGHNSPEVAATALRTLSTIVSNILG